MPELILHREAEAEMWDAASYYESNEPGLGEEFLREVANGFLRIQERPRMFPTLGEEYRRCILQQFPYALVYRLIGKDIHIFAIAHFRRKPEYWTDRE